MAVEANEATLLYLEADLVRSGTLLSEPRNPSSLTD